MSTPPSDDFNRRIIEAGKALEHWEDRDKRLDELFPQEGVCPLCWFAGRNPQPSHVMMILCQHPTLHVVQYTWDEEKRVLVKGAKFVVDRTSIAIVLENVGEQFLTRSEEEFTPGLSTDLYEDLGLGKVLNMDRVRHGEPLFNPNLPEAGEDGYDESLLAVRWFTPMPPQPCIGVVAVLGLDRLDWCAYIGTFSPLDISVAVTSQHIARRGARVDYATALALMPEIETLTELPYRS